jgi:hypothetical protein
MRDGKMECEDFMILIFLSEIGQFSKKNSHLNTFIEDFFTSASGIKYYARDQNSEDPGKIKDMIKEARSHIKDHNFLEIIPARKGKSVGIHVLNYIINIKDNPEKGREFINDNILALFYLVMLFKATLYEKNLSQEDIDKLMKGLIEAINEELKSFAATTKTGTIFKKCEECDFYAWCNKMITI